MGCCCDVSLRPEFSHATTVSAASVRRNTIPNVVSCPHVAMACISAEPDAERVQRDRFVAKLLTLSCAVCAAMVASVDIADWPLTRARIGTMPAAISFEW